MLIRESNNGAGYAVQIDVSPMKGDRFRMFEQDNDHADVPLVVCYNLGVDFDLCTDEEKRARVLSMLKMLRTEVNELMADIGGLVGGHPRKRNYQMEGREIVTSANIPCHSIESSFRTRKGRGWAPPSWGRHL